MNKANYKLCIRYLRKKKYTKVIITTRTYSKPKIIKITEYKKKSIVIRPIYEYEFEKRIFVGFEINKHNIYYVAYTYRDLKTALKVIKKSYVDNN